MPHGILDNIKKVHFIGIGGISMSGLAEILHKKGYKVSGSDMKASEITSRLENMGIEIHIGHDPFNIKDPDLVVYTAAVREDNPELMEAKNRQIPVIDRASLLGEVMKNFKYSIAVSGCHGKTTSTSMISLILERAGLDPTISLGGELDAIGGNFKIGKSEYFVTEACEYVDSFLKLHPYVGVVLNIDRDHLDYFRDLEHIKESFRKFAALIPENGYLVAFKNDPSVQDIIRGLKCNVITYGINGDEDYTASSIIYDQKGYPSFDVYYKGNFLDRFELSIPGKHNVYNALSSIAVARIFSIPTDSIKKTLKEFTGTRRRFQLKGKVDEITVVDDYAHHPAEIKATLEAAKKFPHNRIISIFQPHTYTRTKALLYEFSESFDNADIVIITDIYAAREKDTGLVHSKNLADLIGKRKKEVEYISTFSEIADYIKKVAQKGDLIITMGAGDISNLGPQILENLKAKP